MALPVASLLPRWSYRAAVLSPQSGLPSSVRLVLLALDSYRSDQSPIPFPSQATIASITDLSKRTVWTALRYAAEHGWIKRRLRSRADGGRTSDACEMAIPDNVTFATVADSTPTPLATIAAPPSQSLRAPLATIAEEVVQENRSRKKRTTVPRSAREKNGPWLVPFLVAYKNHVGEPPAGEMGKVLKPMHDTLGPDAALVAFGNWLDSEDVKYGVSKFAQRWRQYVNGAPRKLSRQASNEAAIDQWATAELAKEQAHGIG